MSRPFTVRATDEEVADLRRRLAATRWPDQLPGTTWEYGTDRTHVQEVCRYWEHDYDWDGFHARLNAHPQFLTEVDGVQLHYYDVPAERPDAPVMLLLHGWPGSVAELLDLLGPLSAGGLHLVVPSLPGYGFSGPTTRTGVDARAVADVLDGLMLQLGHDRYLVHGGDWGSFLAVQLAGRHAEHVVGIHTTLLPMVPPPKEVRDEGVTDADRARRAALQAFWAQENGYQSIQGTKPQTLAYALNDSPAGLAGWVLEKFHSWTDPASQIPVERLVDNLSVYWLTGTIGSSMRLYYESNGPGRATPPPSVTVPTGHASFPAEIGAVPRSWAERAFPLVHWTDMPRGGHFAALEAPDLLVADLQAFARTVSSG